MTAVEELLQMLHDQGAFVSFSGDTFRVASPAALPQELIGKLKDRKTELRSLLEREQIGTSSLDLPFPLGYGGLPKAQVEAVGAVNDRFGIRNPAHRKYNVLAWVRGFYQDRGENHGEQYEAIKREQHRLGRILNQDGIGT